MKAWKIKIIYILGHGSLDADYKGWVEYTDMDKQIIKDWKY